MINVGFIGIGKLGMPCAETMAQKYSVLNCNSLKFFNYLRECL
jgi:3-hydroxyisobutyrate dehydrogenase-like beta-hydroxyacid dehydrogenase